MLSSLDDISRLTDIIQWVINQVSTCLFLAPGFGCSITIQRSSSVFSSSSANRQCISFPSELAFYHQKLSNIAMFAFFTRLIAFSLWLFLPTNKQTLIALLIWAMPCLLCDFPFFFGDHQSRFYTTYLPFCHSFMHSFFSCPLAFITANHQYIIRIW